jgi:hypothetical protein
MQFGHERSSCTGQQLMAQRPEAADSYFLLTNPIATTPAPFAMSIAVTTS